MASRRDRTSSLWRLWCAMRRRAVDNRSEYGQLALIGLLAIVATLVLIEKAKQLRRDMQEDGTAIHDGHRDFLTRLSVRTFECAIPTDVPALQARSTRTKGGDYVPFMTPEQNAEYVRTCFTTTWHAIHFTGHAIVVALYPRFVLEVLACSTLFEMYEYSIDVHDFTDIGYNIAGALVGLTLRFILTRTVAKPR